METLQPKTHLEKLAFYKKIDPRSISEILTEESIYLKQYDPLKFEKLRYRTLLESLSNEPFLFSIPTKPYIAYLYDQIYYLPCLTTDIPLFREKWKREGWNKTALLCRRLYLEAGLTLDANLIEMSWVDNELKRCRQTHYGRKGKKDDRLFHSVY